MPFACLLFFTTHRVPAPRIDIQGYRLVARHVTQAYLVLACAVSHG